MQTHTDLKKILVPVPLNSDMTDALTQALRLQQVYGSEITMLTIVSRYSIFHRMLNPEKLNKHRKKAKRRLKKLVKKYFKGEIPGNVKLKVEDGGLISTILKTAKGIDADLIIIKKARRLPGRFKFLKTENADRLIAESLCPVLTVAHHPTPGEIRTIMIPVEILKPSENKIAWAISLAKQFNAGLHLVSVLDADIKVRSSLSYKQSRKIEKVIRSQGIEVKKEVIKSNGDHPGKEVLQHAASVNPDMLVIMTRKESLIRDHYLGSFAREIIHHSQVPVFNVVPATDHIPFDVLRPKHQRAKNSSKQTT